MPEKKKSDPSKDVTATEQPERKSTSKCSTEKESGVTEQKQLTKGTKATDKFNPFVLENVFPNPSELLAIPATKTVDMATDAIFVLDANALLVPFGVGKAGQEEITTLYSGLSEEGRLFVPEYALQEYLRNRAKKIVEVHDRLNQEVSTLGKPVAPPNCAILEYSKEYEALTEAAEGLRVARKKCLEKLQDVQSLLENWQWDDPISQLYGHTFCNDAVVKCTESREKLLDDLTYRVTHKLPPGYKDSSKSDGGIGDLVIWHTILQLGREKELGVVFVTDDSKADWMARGSTGALFPRFELVAEFHRETNQRLAIVNFVRFLELHDLSPDTVDKARHSYAEGLGRFQRLRQRILSILDTLNSVASDYFYASDPDDCRGITDNRLTGLVLGFGQCLSAYSSIYESGPGFQYLQKFEALLKEMSTLNAGLEYEAVRMKRDMSEEELKLKRLCETFMEHWADFSEFSRNTPDW